jgi:hypothetical protein
MSEGRQQQQQKKKKDTQTKLSVHDSHLLHMFEGSSRRGQASVHGDLVYRHAAAGAETATSSSRNRTQTGTGVTA